MDHIPSFIDYISSEKRFTTDTIIAYKADITKFISFINNLQIDYKEVTTKQISSWFMAMATYCAVSSSRRRLAAIRSFYKHLLNIGVVKSNPATLVTLPKLRKRLPTFIKKDEILNVINDLGSASEDDFINTQRKLIIQLLYGTGIRVRELIRLKISDVNLKNNTIRVFGKGNKERIIPFPKALNKTIVDYLSCSNDINKNNVYLIVTKKGDPSYYTMINRIVKNCIASCSNLSKRTPHILRHTFATHLLDNGAELNSIKEMLGHQSIVSTQVYTHTSLEKLKSILNKSHPRG